MDVRFVSDTGVEHVAVDELGPLLADRADRAGTRRNELIWVDVPSCDEETAHMLSEVFGFHPLAVRDCLQRNPVPKVHIYADHVFVVLHAPEQGAAGHVHYLELDQFIGPGYLVTVHGPVNPAVDPDAATAETRAVLRRLEKRRPTPTTSHQLSGMIVTALAVRLRDYVAVLTKDVWRLEQRVTAGDVADPEQFLEELFRTRHGLLTVRTMAALSGEVYGRMATLVAFGPDGQRQLTDAVDQFSRIRTMADGQKEYLQGVIEFYQTRTHTKMTIAAERLAVIAAVTLPITALSSVLGMNVIVNEQTRYGLLAGALSVMAVMSVTLLVWAKRKGWW